MTSSPIFDERRGVFRLPAGEPDLTADARERGWHAVVLDTADVGDKEAFMNVVADTFGLPSWFGHSWDALDGCLRALGLDEPDGLLVLWDHWGEFADADPDSFELAVEVFQDACVAWEDDEFGGAVLLRGEGPETDLAVW